MLILMTSSIEYGVTEARELEALLARIAQGDKDALGQLYERTHAAVYGFAMSLSHCPADAEDVLQETYINVYAAAERYSDFVKQHRSGKILYLELGVGNNTPAIIKYPFWRMTLQNPNAIYASINLENMMIPQIENQSILINMDIASAVKRLSQKE